MTKLFITFVVSCCGFFSPVFSKCSCNPPPNLWHLSSHLNPNKSTYKGKPRKPLELLITGCARSGTTYTTKFLQKCGLAIRHEEDAAYGIISWSMAVDSDRAAWGQPSGRYTFKHIFHQVRHPLKTIGSAMMTEGKQSWLFISRQIHQIKLSDPKLVRAAKYWYYWNLKAESKSEMTYRIEDIASVLPEMSRRLGVPLDPAQLDEVSPTTNTRRHATLTWLDLRKAVDDDLYAKIVCLAKRYGYDVKEAKRYLR